MHVIIAVVGDDVVVVTFIIKFSELVYHCLPQGRGEGMIDVHVWWVGLDGLDLIPHR